MSGTLGFLRDHTATETPAQALARQAYQAAERADRQAERDEADQAVALEEAAEARAFTFRALNVQPGAVLAAALQAQEEDFAYDAARSQMEKIDRRRELRRRQAQDQADQLAAASRAANGQPGWVNEANRAAAALRVEQMLTGPAPRGRRPFAVRSAVRSEHECVFCTAGNVDPETSFLLHSDPDRRVPVTTAEQVTQQDLDEVRQDTGRSRFGGKEISR